MRVFVLMLFFMLGFKLAVAVDIPLYVNWQDYKNKYLRDNSYIVDPYNNYRVTSESQGYGLLLALKYNDEKTFDNIYSWTKSNLQRKDHLFSWYWLNGKVMDPNDATDGDLLIAYALYKAYKKWHKDYYLDEFKKIDEAIKKKLIVNILYKDKITSILLPAVLGFSNYKYQISIFPSYYIDFILKDFSKHDKQWKLVYDTLKNDIYNIKNLTDTLNYSLVNKNFETTDAATLNVYRLIPYSYMSGEINPQLKKDFEPVNEFFEKNGYIPYSFYYNKNSQEKTQAPFCVYEFFYLLYGDKKYLDKYNELAKVDKINYFCDSFELFLSK